MIPHVGLYDKHGEEGRREATIIHSVAAAAAAAAILPRRRLSPGGDTLWSKAPSGPQQPSPSWRRSPPTATAATGLRSHTQHSTPIASISTVALGFAPGGRPTVIDRVCSGEGMTTMASRANPELLERWNLQRDDKDWDEYLARTGNTTTSWTGAMASSSWPSPPMTTNPSWRGWRH